MKLFFKILSAIFVFLLCAYLFITIYVTHQLNWDTFICVVFIALFGRFITLKPKKI